MLKRLLLLLLSLNFIALPAFASDWAESERGLEMIRAADASVIAKTEILTAYGLNYWLYQMPLQVSVQNNTATVIGSVENELQKHLALEIAKAAQGIRQVVDKIQVNTNTEKKVAQVKFIQHVRDLNIASKIIKKIAKDNPFYGKINVTSYHGHITLTGTVKNAKQKQQAERIAAQTTGVEGVENQLEIE